jgi:phage FluMu protein Com
MRLFEEKCPRCQSTLEVKNHSSSKTIIVKACPADHYEKEFHPALETYIETFKVS